MGNDLRVISRSLSKAKRKLNELEKKFRDQEKVVNELRDKMTALMIEAGTTSYNSADCQVSLRELESPTVTDWEKVYRYIKNNDAIELLQRRISAAAWKDRLEDRKAPIPGIETFVRKTLYVRLKEEN